MKTITVGCILLTLYLVYVYLLAPIIKSELENLAFHPPKISSQHMYSNWDHHMIGRNNTISTVLWTYPKATLTVLYSHGTGDDLTVIAKYMETICNKFKVNVIGYDYSGYGLSSGTVGESTIYNDIRIVYDYCINNLQLKPNQIVVWGQSLGTAASLNLASSESNIGGIIIQSGFYSILSIVLPDQMVWILRRMDLFNNKNHLYNMNTNCLIIHGINDEIIPFKQAENMANILQNNGKSFNKLWLDIGHEWRDLVHTQPKFNIAIQTLFESVLKDILD